MDLVAASPSRKIRELHAFIVLVEPASSSPAYLIGGNGAVSRVLVQTLTNDLDQDGRYFGCIRRRCCVDKIRIGTAKQE